MLQFPNQWLVPEVLCQKHHAAGSRPEVPVQSFNARELQAREAEHPGKRFQARGAEHPGQMFQGRGSRLEFATAD